MRGRQTNINGVDIQRLQETVGSIKSDPGLARCRFRATDRWLSGGHNRTMIHDFYGARQVIAHERDFKLEVDEPPLLLGQDKGPNPVEYVLTALAGCLTSSLIFQAAAHGIAIDEVESELEGDLDLRGFLGISDQVRNGYENIRVNFRIKSDAPQAKLDELVRLAQQRSPVFDIVTHPVPVTVTAEKVKESLH
jgi:uncharacterized OsmC-like protein